jgi:DNA-directed RNA polymerase specialized sigma24 family protein
VKAVVEDTAELVLEGLSREGIAARLGIKWDAVRQAYRRAGVPLPVMYD